MKSLILVLMLAGTCWGQTTQPLVNENSKLRAENARLKNQVAELVEQVDQLTAELDGLRALVNSPPPTTSPIETPIQAAIREHKLVIGMTLAQAKKAAGHGVLVAEQDGGVRIYRFAKSHYTTNADGAIVETGRTEIHARFENDRLVAYGRDLF
jgi:uncharacterized protein YlxW (UPF0749 family)